MYNEFFSIDQNSHPLWDAVPKLDALARHGWHGTHFVEDVDVAFTRRSAAVGDTHLELAREQFYRGGMSDWGATLFYSDILGRLPLDVRQLEPYSGWTTAALSRRLGMGVDVLYDTYSPSDNWQLVGPSFAGAPTRHRVIGDLRVGEISPHLLELLRHARIDFERIFPRKKARQRLKSWFDQEDARVKELLRDYEAGTLVDLYRAWMSAHLSKNVKISATSELLSSDKPNMPNHELLEVFLSNYEAVAALYNEAVQETASGLNLLNVNKGELPFFAVIRRDNRLFRISLTLRGENVVAEDFVWPLAGPHRSLPLQQMRRDGLFCIVGKALLLVLHARFKPLGKVLALPYNGSLYMPAAHRLEQKLFNNGYLPQETFPIYRVKLNFLEHWQACKTVIQPPAYLQPTFGTGEYRACDFAEELFGRIKQARSKLEQMTSPDGRDRIMKHLFAEEMQLEEELEKRRRDLARDPETRAQAAEVWAQLKEIKKRLQVKVIDWIVQQLRVIDLEYYNSRGAILPQSIALGGEAFYNQLLADAEIYAEKPETNQATYRQS